MLGRDIGDNRILLGQPGLQRRDARAIGRAHVARRPGRAPILEYFAQALEGLACQRKNTLGWIWYSSHRSDTATLSTRCRLRIVAFSSGVNRRRCSVPFVRLIDSSSLHVKNVEQVGVTFQLRRDTTTCLRKPNPRLLREGVAASPPSSTQHLLRYHLCYLKRFAVQRYPEAVALKGSVRID